VTSAERLAAAPFEVVGRFAAASNATLLVRLVDRDPRPFDALAQALGRAPEIDDFDTEDLAVYKPQDGERPLWDFPTGTLHRREVAAHVIDRALGLDLVPTTVLRADGPFGPGSLQRFVPHDPAEHFFTLRVPAIDGSDPGLRSRLIELAVLDVVIDNADRKGGHVLVESGRGPRSARLRAVDHGVSFNVEPKLRTVLWDLASSPLPRAIDDALAALEVALGGELGLSLATLLSADEVTVTRHRIAALRVAGVLPEPSGERPYPWPLL
jgi:uncharacterized repeat protein (TIGR03843 family)